MMIEADSGCKCCQKFMRTGDPWHCKDCWDKHHNGKIHNDWKTREEFESGR